MSLRVPVRPYVWTRSARQEGTQGHPTPKLAYDILYLVPSSSAKLCRGQYNLWEDARVLLYK